MSGRRNHWLTRLYPRDWRTRYGDELEALIEEEGRGWRQSADLMKSAAVQRILQLSRVGVEAMNTYPGNLATLVRKPSAIVPIAMSLAALATVLIAIAVAGAKPELDEGAAAHIFQILLAGQLPFVAWFALHWLKRDLKASLAILGLQFLAVAAALFPVWFLGL